MEGRVSEEVMSPSETVSSRVIEATSSRLGKRISRIKKSASGRARRRAPGAGSVRIIHKSALRYSI